jgi:exopolysaccharide production protein ExoQ
MGPILRLLEYGFTVASLVLYMGGILFVLISGGANQSDVAVTYDTSLFRLSFIVIYLITAGLLLLRWKQALYTLAREPLIPALVMLVFASTFWSSLPSRTLIDSITLAGSTLFGLYLATRYTLKQQLGLICWAFGIGVVLSFPFAILLPAYGKMGGLHAGAWRGVYTHKNGLGASMVSSTMAFIILAFQYPRQQWLAWIGVILSLVLLVLSRSTAALINVTLIISAITVLKIVRWRYRSLIIAIMSLVLFLEITVILLVGNAETIADVLGKDLTLTGRTVLWSAVWEMIQKQPWLGYGYGAFWDVRSAGSQAAQIWLATGWKMNHPHNGFLALWLDIGLVGLVLFLLIFIQGFYRSLVLVRLDHNAAPFLPVVTLFFLVISNLGESALLESNSFPWVFFVCLTLTVTKELERKAVEPRLIESPPELRLYTKN